MKTKKFIATVLTLFSLATPVCMSASADWRRDPLMRYSNAIDACYKKGDYNDECIREIFESTVPSLPVSEGSKSKFYWFYEDCKDHFEKTINDGTFDRYAFPDGLITPKGNIVHRLGGKSLASMMNYYNHLAGDNPKNILDYAKKTGKCSDDTSKELCNNFERLHSLVNYGLLHISDYKPEDIHIWSKWQ